MDRESFKEDTFAGPYSYCIHMLFSPFCQTILPNVLPLFKTLCLGGCMLEVCLYVYLKRYNFSACSGTQLYVLLLNSIHTFSSSVTPGFHFFNLQLIYPLGFSRQTVTIIPLIVCNNKSLVVAWTSMVVVSVKTISMACRSQKSFTLVWNVKPALSFRPQWTLFSLFSNS